MVRAVHKGTSMGARLMAAVFYLSVGFAASLASAQERFDIGVLGGWTKPSAAGTVMQFNFGTRISRRDAGHVRAMGKNRLRSRSATR